jgi:hypothetical protein
MSWLKLLTEKQFKDVLLSEYYVDFLEAYGTDGHSRLVLINSLAKLLKRAEDEYGVDFRKLMEPKPLTAYLAQRAYEAYGKSTNFKNFQGNPMPAWEELPEAIHQAWFASVESVKHDLNAS